MSSLIDAIATASISLPEALLAVAVSVLIAVVLCVIRARVNLRRVCEQAAHDRSIVLERLESREQDLSRQEGELRMLRTALDERVDQLATVREESAALRARMQAAEAHHKARDAERSQAAAQLKHEFQSLAASIFESQGRAHSQRLDGVIGPFREQMQDFRNRVDQVYSFETRDRATLLAEVRNLQQASERINQEAAQLTLALKGDKRLQGSWGELVLERILEASGLRPGHEYFTQSSQRNEAGALKRPDVVVRLPDERDIVIDAKTSLAAYEQAIAADEEPYRQQFMREHVKSFRAHVQKLAEQSYEQLPQLRSLDFVLMFVPVEPAFAMAMETDERLFSEAFEKRVVIVSPATLMMTLRIVQNLWRQEKQSRNAREIAERAGALYDKLRGFVEEMDRLGAQLDTASRTFDTAYSRLSSGKGNLIRQAERFRELGAGVKKALPQDLVERACAEDDSEESRSEGG